MFSKYWLCFRKWIFLGLAVAVVLLSSFKGPYSLWSIYHFRKQRDQIKSDILQLSEENNLLRQEIQKLHSDPECVSRIAREELGLVKPGEIIYRYHHQNQIKNHQNQVQNQQNQVQNQRNQVQNQRNLIQNQQNQVQNQRNLIQNQQNQIQNHKNQIQNQQLQDQQLQKGKHAN
jgi:cell division protein FtsB